MMPSQNLLANFSFFVFTEREEVHPHPTCFQTHEVWDFWLHHYQVLQAQVLWSLHGRSLLHPSQNRHLAHGVQVPRRPSHEEADDVHQDLRMPLQLPWGERHLWVHVLQEDGRWHGVRRQRQRCQGVPCSDCPLEFNRYPSHISAQSTCLSFYGLLLSFYVFLRVCVCILYVDSGFICCMCINLSRWMSKARGVGNVKWPGSVRTPSKKKYCTIVRLCDAQCHWLADDAKPLP